LKFIQNIDCQTIKFIININELVDKNQALEVDDFAQTIKENQQLMKLGKGVRFICIKAFNRSKSIINFPFLEYLTVSKISQSIRCLPAKEFKLLQLTSKRKMFQTHLAKFLMHNYA
jgi:hypothetical protein